MTARFIVADVFDGLATLDDNSVDLVVTSPPFLALRSYLPADHPDKDKEMGSEATPAEFVDTLLKVMAELRRVLAPHGSVCVELGDTYAGSTGTANDRPQDDEDSKGRKYQKVQYDGHAAGIRNMNNKIQPGGTGWPLPKSLSLIPEAFRMALAYGVNPHTGAVSPAGKWRIRNVIRWVRPNPPVGALGDKWRPATSDLVVATVSGKRYWDDLATRKPWVDDSLRGSGGWKYNHIEGLGVGRTAADFARRAASLKVKQDTHGGAPLLDWWEIPPGGYQGAHYAVFPQELVVPCIQAMAPPKVCQTCGQPSRRIISYNGGDMGRHDWDDERGANQRNPRTNPRTRVTSATPEGWTDCGHDNWRPALILDPFAGSGTTLGVATGFGHDAIGIDIDQRNEELARDRVGPFLFESVEV